MRSEQDITAAINRYGDTVMRICMVYLKNTADTEDIFQEVFLKYAQSDKAFDGEEHKKAWIIKVAINACKDMIKSFFRSKTTELDDSFFARKNVSDETIDVLTAVLSLPQKYKTVVYLHFYEGYTAPQIGQILGKNTNSVYTLITRAKKLLKERSEDYE